MSTLFFFNLEIDFQALSPRAPHLRPPPVGARPPLLLAAEVRRLTGMREDMDPEFEADFQKLMQTYAARRQ
jgi:hypothetical protein